MRQADLSTPAHRVLGGILRQQAEHVGDDDFLVDDDRRLTYGAADDLADRHAAGYAELGVGRGDTVALMMHNSADMGLTSFGVNRLGAIWSPVSNEYRGEWLGRLLRGTRSEVLVIDDDLWPAVAALPEIGFRHVVVRGSAGAVREQAPAGVTVHDYAWLDQHDGGRYDAGHYGDTNAVLWTSGTTGPSKGVMQSHNVWVTYCQRQNEAWRQVREGERFWACLPMFNSGGWLMNIYPALLSGSAACIDRRFSATEFWDRIRHFDANHSIVLGAMFMWLMQRPPRDDDADNPLRTAVMVPALPEVMYPFMERFGIESVGCGLGQSEIMGATLYHSDWPLKPGSCGYVQGDDYPVEVTVLDEHDNEVPVGEVGEMCVRPRVPFAIYNGYWGEPQRTLEAVRNLWHHTGDLARVDDDGELFFVDRKKDSLRHGGRNISTFEVEHVARRFPGVVQVAAVGVKVAELGDQEEVLMVCIEPAEGAGIDPLEFCRYMDANAPYFFVPRYVQIVETMPVTPTNKIEKYKLREKGVDSTTWDRLRDAPAWKPSRTVTP